MFGEKSGTAIVCQEDHSEAPHSWRGATFFSKEEQVSKKEGYVFVELPSGIHEVKVEDFEERKRLRREEEEQQAFQEAYLLMNCGPMGRS